MNLQKITLVLLFIIVSSTVFAQEELDSQIKHYTETVNIRLTKNNENLKLSEAQENQVNALYKTFFLTKKEKSKSIRKKEDFKTVMKVERQKLNQSIKSLLKPKQLVAYNSYRAK